MLQQIHILLILFLFLVPSFPCSLVCKLPNAAITVY